jgi:hypothetical protein
MAQNKKPSPAKAAPTAPKKSELPEKKAAVAPAKPAPVEAPAKVAKPADKEKGKARDALRSRILGSKKPIKPIAFSLEGGARDRQDRGNPRHPSHRKRPRRLPTA